MIKKLRKKFILINMTLVTLVLVIVFAVLLISNTKKYREDSMRALERVLNEEWGEIPGGFTAGRGPKEIPDSMNPVFVVSLNASGSITEIDNSRITVDEEFARQAVDAARDSGKSFGMLRSFRVRFLKQETTAGIKIAFEDCGREIDAVNNLVMVSIIIFVGGMAAFLLISLYLSKWALAPVERAWRQQKQFVADASHELKTPLTVIMANLGILSAHPGDTIQEQHRWVENTQMEASRMKQLLDSMMFLAKSDASGVPAEHEEFDLSNTLLSSVLPFESIAYEQEVTLEEQIMPDIRIYGDEGQFKQLAAILLDNACKYALKGGRVAVRFHTERPGRAVLEVQNSGEPIPQEDLEHIFERFYRSDKSRVRTKGGYGLGLAIAKTIVENHKGKIEVESSTVRGTVFKVTLPVIQSRTEGMVQE